MQQSEEQLEEGPETSDTSSAHPGDDAEQLLLKGIFPEEPDC